MRTRVSELAVFRPSALAEALVALDAEGDGLTPLAGGTDLMVYLEAGTFHGRRFLDLTRVAALRGLTVEPGSLTIGATTTFGELRDHPIVAQEFPALALASAEIGARTIQNRATLAGNVANASPAADAPPALLVYDAEIGLVSRRGERWLPYASFHSAYKKTERAADELILGFRLPRAAPTPGESVFHRYRKVGTRKAQAIAKVTLAARWTIVGGRIENARIAAGAIAPIPLRCRGAEAAADGKRLGGATPDLVATALGFEITPIDDLRSSARYRREVAAQVLARFFTPP